MSFIFLLKKKKNQNSYHFFSYPGALSLVASGKINVKRLITHHFNIEETAEAFNTSRHGLGGAIKVMIHVQPKDKNNPK